MDLNLFALLLSLAGKPPNPEAPVSSGAWAVTAYELST